MATVRVSFLLGGERFYGRLNRSSVLSDVPAKATRVNRAGPGYKVIRLRRLSHTRQLQSSYPRPKSLDLLKRVVAVLPRWKLASGRQQLRRHFFQFLQLRRPHFPFAFSPSSARFSRGQLHPTICPSPLQPEARRVVQARSSTIGFSGAVSGLSYHFTAGSSQLMHWRSVRPERVTTGTIRFSHFGQLVVRSMRASRFSTPNQELELLF